MARATQPTTLEQAAAGVATARQALATIQERVNSGVSVTASELAAARDILQLAEMTLQAAQDRAATAERAALEQRQADVTAVIVADDTITTEARDAVIQTACEAALDAYEAAAGLLAERDVTIAEHAGEARLAGIPQAEIPSWGGFEPAQVPGFTVSPTRDDGLIVDGVTLKREPESARRDRLFNAIRDAVAERAGQPGYIRPALATVPVSDRPVQEARQAREPFEPTRERNPGDHRVDHREATAE